MDRFDIANKDTDSSRRENRRDSLYMDRNRYRGSLDVAKKLVGPQALLEGLFETENSMERLLWRLSCGLSVSEIESATGLYLSCMRKSFILATGDASEIDELLRNTGVPLNENLKATKVDKGEFYAFPEPQPASDIATLRTGVMIKNFSIKSHLITGTQPGPYPKEQWELFWQVYNLVQEG
jgi:hypothetical protein